jgi:hypothetical protein
MRKLKSGRGARKLSVTTSIFLPKDWEAPRFLLVLVRAPRKGQASSRVTPWIDPDLPHTQVVSKMASPEPLPVIVTNELLAKMLWASFPPVHYGSHTTNVIDVVS